MPDNIDPAGGVRAAVARGVDYEITIADLARRSERRAWGVAAVASLAALMLTGACLAMLPLKERVPFLVMADASSGTASIARLDESFRNRAVTASEAINRSNVANFVTMREAYDLELINLHDWRAVHSMSAPEVGRAYSAAHSKRNPDSPYNLYGANSAIRTRILSIALIDDSGGEATGATVRFQRSVYDKRNGALEPLDSKIATMAFKYDLGLRLEERDRLQNPLGFRVTAYRVENDYAASPPLAHPVVPRSGPMPGGYEPVEGAADTAATAVTSTTMLSTTSTPGSHDATPEPVPDGEGDGAIKLHGEHQ